MEKEKIPHIMGEKEYKKEDFCHPSFYIDFFGDCLEKLEDEKTDNVQWLTTVLLGTQIMRSEIGDYFDPDFKEELNTFLDFSLNGGYCKDGVTDADVDLSKEFVQETVDKLSTYQNG